MIDYDKKRLEIAGLKVDTYTNAQLLEVLAKRLAAKERTFLVTVYSEFLRYSLLHEDILELLNGANISVPDGIAIPWAEQYLRKRLRFQNYYLKILESVVYMASSLARIVLIPKSYRTVFPEKIVGADLVWDLAKLCEQQKLSLFLLGGFGDTPKIVSEKLKEKFPNLDVWFSNRHPHEQVIVDEIRNSRAAVVLVAYGPLKQERWIAQHKDAAGALLYIGVGGTFDYI
ncbi:MAG TPA: WecB/TagA/CpsF family glycosyltransferase, partial [Patescibacteria group bacterium]|nr:WecB/TagA/CpsF family glycosyltransferase [Patescibacteria group bacterium]